ncbi:DUF4186 domain-containing protein [Pantoea ananatis]|uniref:DUF4186 domain-containing protein n=1 Tax=Pantoea ananas TaxID=553 RepID=UPI001FF46D46|nr:DUF4186 domain-containing protein [Pantoea ananatis]MCK0552726.1 DUF4186 domain-containing protein [Pantoea ananatis]
MNTFDALFQRLAQSPFRQRFRLGRSEYDYCLTKGEADVATHAATFIQQRLAASAPPNDGKQTPMRGHPVFIAQHATATCCRGCLAKWHGIAQHQVLDDKHQAYVVAVIMHWIHQAMTQPAPAPRERKGRTATQTSAPDSGQLDLW